MRGEAPEPGLLHRSDACSGSAPIVRRCCRQTGDRVRLDLNKGTLDVQLSDGELNERWAEWEANAPARALEHETPWQERNQRSIAPSRDTKHCAPPETALARAPPKKHCICPNQRHTTRSPNRGAHAPATRSIDAVVDPLSECSWLASFGCGRSSIVPQWGRFRPGAAWSSQRGTSGSPNACRATITDCTKPPSLKSALQRLVELRVLSQTIWPLVLRGPHPSAPYIL